MEFDAERCIWRYDDILVDPLQRRLVREGVVLDIEERAFDLIVLLAARRGRAVDRREITAALWGSRPVGENTLRQVVYKARRALADDGTRQIAIRTVRGRSLRWVAPIAPVHAVDVSSSAATTFRAIERSSPFRRAQLLVRLFLCLALATLVGGPVAGRRSVRVAILPIENATGEANLDWTREGLPGLLASLLEDHGVGVVDPHAVALAWEHLSGAQRERRLRETIGAAIVVDGRLSRDQGLSYELELAVRATSGQKRIVLHGERPAALAAEAVPRLHRALQAQVVSSSRAATQVAPESLPEGESKGRSEAAAKISG